MSYEKSIGKWFVENRLDSTAQEALTTHFNNNKDKLPNEKILVSSNA